MTRAHERLRYRLLCVAVVVFPLTLLLAVNDVFYLDWLNHVWMVSYYSDFFRAHRTFPDVINATQAVGLAHPIFYAHFFYAFTGLLGAFLGPDLAIRMIIFALMAAQFHAVFRLFESFTSNRVFATVIATLVTWSVYPLTNIYNRGAITEFAAVCLLNMSVCVTLRMLSLERATSQVLSVLAASLFMTLAALIHPITGALGGVVVCVLFGFVAVFHRDRLRLGYTLIPSAVLALAVLSPWLYALFRFLPDLPVNADVSLHTYRFDTFLVRLAPFPFDPRTLISGRQIDSPFLDAQINVTIVVLLITMWVAFGQAGAFNRFGHSSSIQVFRRRLIENRSAIALAVLAAVGLLYGFAISLGWVPAMVPHFVARAQFGYRLVTYQNLCLLMLALAATQYYTGRAGNKEVLVAGVAFAVSLSFVGVLIKLTRADAVNYQGGPWHTLAERASLPDSLYSLGDYSVLSGARESPISVNTATATFSRASGGDFATVDRVELSVDRDSIVKSNIYLFPWNKVLIDSREVPRFYYRTEQYPYGRKVFLTSFMLPAGRHTVEYRFSPDPIWKTLRRISFVALGAWVLLCLALASSAILPRTRA